MSQDRYFCPFCGEIHVLDSFGSPEEVDQCDYWQDPSDSGFYLYYCKTYRRVCAVHQYIIQPCHTILSTDLSVSNYLLTETQDRLINLMVEHLIRHGVCNENGREHYWHFYYDPDFKESALNGPQYINLAARMQEYPTQVIDIAHRTLMNLATLYPKYSQQIPLIEYRYFRLGFDCQKELFSCLSIRPLMEELQLIIKYTGVSSKVGQLYTITALGWQKIDELRKQEQTVRQGFIAMSFHEEANPIRKSFCEAIIKSGYTPMILDEKEHNNQIVPEIFYEIKRSKFVVVDVTYPNYGAYYEAGYAQALGKPVIICCQKQSYEDPAKRPHFDIAQQSIVVWETHEELVARLKRRIESTVQ